MGMITTMDTGTITTTRMITIMVTTMSMNTMSMTTGMRMVQRSRLSGLC